VLNCIFSSYQKQLRVSGYCHVILQEQRIVFKGFRPYNMFSRFGKYVFRRVAIELKSGLKTLLAFTSSTNNAPIQDVFLLSNFVTS